MIERILMLFRYVKKLDLEARQLRHDADLYQKLIASMTTHRDVLTDYISTLKSEKARLEKREEDREEDVRKFVKLALQKGRS